jgi:SAM-dependent methyltransferase
LPFIYGELLSYDRWRWIKRNLPNEYKNTKIIDIGCGKGTYVIELSREGVDAIGVTYDFEDVVTSNKRAQDFGVKCCFRQIDARNLEKENNLKNNFDVIISAELIEHIINDKKLVFDMFNILKKNGVILLTTPYYKNAKTSDKPVVKKEDGGHMRPGYNNTVLKNLFQENGFQVEKINYCGGPISQKSFNFFHKIRNKKNYIYVRILMLPLKFLFPMDYFLLKLKIAKPASICIRAKKI